MARVDRVHHVCGPLAILSCLTYFFPTHSPTILTLFFHCVAGSIWLLHIYFLGTAPHFSEKVIFTVYHGSDFHAYPCCCTTGWLWQWCWPTCKQCLCQNPQILYVKNNMRVLHFTKVSEWLISQLLPWLKVRVLVCKTTISLFTDTGS